MRKSKKNVLVLSLLVRNLRDTRFVFHLSPRFYPSTSECSPPSVSSIALCLLLSCSRWFTPSLLCRLAIFCMVVLVDLLPLLGCHSVQRLVHLLSFVLATCPAHLHFCFIVYSIMSIIFVLFLISEHGILSYSFRPNIFLSIAL